MKTKTFSFIFASITFLVFTMAAMAQNPRIDTDNDLLLVQYDCKTDVDDLHSVAAFRTIIANPACKNLNYHAVAGTYGIQKGLYVPPNELFELAFGNQWSDAHSNFDAALKEVE